MAIHGGSQYSRNSRRFRSECLRGSLYSFVQVLHGDARDLSREALQAYTDGEGFQTVLSDMCHDTMGAGDADVAASLELCECAATIAVGNGFYMPQDGYEMLPRDAAESARVWNRGVLRHGGSLVMKILEGSGTKEFADSLKPFFMKVAFLRPKATRRESREVYIVCMGHCDPPNRGRRTSQPSQG
jgi:23S rRNA U2552 (ribose-2'-O)-methylase RlmE/FtsJ